MSSLFLSLSDLQQKIHHRELKPSSVVEEHIDRCKEVNPKINALVADRYSEALAEGKEQDKLWESKKTLPALWGIPCSIKEMLAVKGMPQTAGMLERKGSIATEDASVVKSLRDQGAIVLGVTNVPELGLWFESSNLVYGRTKNPFDLNRTPGGSSGGEAALVAAGGVPFGIGSDVGGSIRMPAAFCGIAGHKPSHFWVPYTGHYPMTPEKIKSLSFEQYPYTVVGPLTRYASDLKLILNIIAKTDGIDPLCSGAPTAGVQGPLEGRKVFLLPQPKMTGVRKVSSDLSEACKQAAEALKAKGMIIESLPDDIFKEAYSLWAAATGEVKGTSFSEKMRPGENTRLAEEFMRYALLKPRHTFPVLGYAFVEKLNQKAKRFVSSKAPEKLAKIKSMVHSLLDEKHFILMPPHPRPAPRHNEPIANPFDFAFTGIGNALRLPSSIVTWDLNSKNLPLAVQLIGSDNQDFDLLELSSWIEESRKLKDFASHLKV